MEFERKPIDQDAEPKPPEAERPGMDRDALMEDLRGAAEASGVDKVKAALAQVATGEADPAALLDWIDELRDPEIRPEPEIEPPLGFKHDFVADSEFALDTDAPGAEANDAPTNETDELDLDHYVFVTRRRRGDDDEDEDEDGEPVPEPPDKRTKPA